MKSLEVQMLEFERDQLLLALEELVTGLEKTNWSSWQATDKFSDQQESARGLIDALRIKS